jgi:Patatin-like phospholipase
MDSKFGKKSQDNSNRIFNNLGDSFDRLGSFRDFIFQLWIPTLSGIISFILFGLIGQSIEIYHSLILDRGSLQISWIVFNIFWLSFFTWQSARLLAFKYSLLSTIRITWICLLGVLPFLGLICGVLQSNNFQNSNDEKYAINWIILCIAVLLSLILWFSLGFKKDKRLFRRSFSKIYNNKLAKIVLRFFFGFKEQDTTYENDGLFAKIHENIIINMILMWFSVLTIPIVTATSGILSWGFFMVFATCVFFNGILLWWSCNTSDSKDRVEDNQVLVGWFLLNIAVVIGSTFLPPLLISEQFGAISIAAVSISSFTVIFSTIYSWGRDLRIPSVSLIIIGALIWSLSNSNDNHQVRYSKNTSSPTYSSSLEKSFKDWFENRTDLKAFKEKGLKEYPVYVVSAQGGGIYAAYHSATALSKLHDTIPNFSDHVFAISSVSGGSLGSSVYSALVKNSQNNPSPLAENASVNPDCKKLTLCTKAHEIINQDFLSPLFALGLFPDILQRFIPLPVNDWDRSRGLEIALEESWKKALNTDNILAQPYYQFWHPSKRAPALVLNTTTVETGERLLFSPFTIPYSSSKTMLDFNKVEDSNVPLSTAAGLSARFPIVSSAGWFTYEKAGKKYTNRLVDGGYYDNSGLVTARDIVSALSVNQKDSTESVLDELNNKYGIRPKLINLAIVDVPKPTVGSSARGFDGILSPLTTVLNVRNTRGSGVVAQAAYDLNRDATKPEDYRFRAFYLDKEMAKLPLGWLLSKTSQDAIEKQNPSYETCKELKMTQLILGMKDKINTIENNSCVAKSIFMELNPKSLIVPQPLKKVK